MQHTHTHHHAAFIIMHHSQHSPPCSSVSTLHHPALIIMHHSHHSPPYSSVSTLHHPVLTTCSIHHHAALTALTTLYISLTTKPKPENLYPGQSTNTIKERIGKVLSIAQNIGNKATCW